MVWDQELFLPPHEDCTTISVTHRQVWLLQLVLHMSESRESLPVDHILLLIRTPILCQEPVPTAYNLCIKVGGEFWPVVGQTTYPQVTA